MLNQDTLLRVTSLLDNETLEKLSHTHLWSDINKFADTPQFWFLRTENLVGIDLPSEVADWKKIYYILEQALSRRDPFWYVDTSEVIAIWILLHLGYDPSIISREEDEYWTDNNDVLYRASEQGHSETVRLLLSDPRVDPARDGIILYGAARYGGIEVTKLLLADPRIKMKNEVFFGAAESGSEEVVKFLLEEYNIDPSIENNEALVLAASNLESTEVMKILLADSRVDSLDKALVTACLSRNVEAVKLLLSDPRVDPSANDNEAMKNARSSEVADLLLKDKRIYLDQLVRDVNFRNLLQLVFNVIQDKALGLYAHLGRSLGYKTQRILYPYYRSLALLLILRRPTFEEALEWILLHPNREMRDAARSISSGRIDHKRPLVTAYLGFLLLAIPEMDLEKIQNLLREEGASDEGIKLASGLIGAFLGTKQHSRVNYTSIYELLKS